MGQSFPPGSNMKATFKISPDELLELAKVKDPVQYSKPLEIGCFSFSNDRVLTLDRSQLVHFNNQNRYSLIFLDEIFSNARDYSVRRFEAWI